MKTLIRCLLLFTFFNATSQIEFEANIIVDYTFGPTDIIFIQSQDMDGDGDYDVVAASNDRISWYENKDGLGTFAALEPIAEIESGLTTSIFVADIDGDGDYDVLASIAPSRISWYENTDGLGNFGTEQIITTSVSGAEQVLALDIDGDSDLDVISASKNDNTLAWYENTNGNGDFGSANIITDTADGINRIAIGDIDNDGFIDIVAGEQGSGIVGWYRNIDNSGNFSIRQYIYNGVLDLRAISVADLDGDGFLDVVSASYQEDTVYWGRNIDGTGNFTAKIIIMNGSAEQVKDIHTVDLDSDNDIDLLVAHQNDKIVRLYNNGNGVFPGGGQIIDNHANTAAFVYAADLDGDNDIDVLSGSTSPGAAWYENLNNSNLFGDVNEIGYTLEDPRSFVAADLDEDGDIDIAVADFTRNIDWFVNFDGNGSFGPPFEIPSTMSREWRIIAADLNGNNRLDIIVSGTLASSNDAAVSWHKNKPAPFFFDGTRLVDVDVSVWEMETGDIDGDGDIDIIASRGFDDEISWYENTTGDSDWSEPRVVHESTNNVQDIKVADLDGDLDLDVIAVVIDGNESDLVWFKNLDGNGNFGSTIPISSSIYSRTIGVGDVDNDGDIDVFAEDDGGIYWQENLDGLGNFGDKHVIPTNDNTFSISSIELGDLDNDGDLDLVASGTSGATISWYENTDGLGTFGSQQIVEVWTERAQARDCRINDIDGDGDLDIIAIFDSDDSLVWYENDLILSTEDYNASNFIIYPNPTDHTFEIQSSEKVTTVSIYNYLGQEMKTIHDSEGITQVNIQDLSQGVYIVRLTNIQGNYSIKRIVKK